MLVRFKFHLQVATLFGRNENTDVAQDPAGASSDEPPTTAFDVDSC